MTFALSRSSLSKIKLNSHPAKHEFAGGMISTTSPTNESGMLLIPVELRLDLVIVTFPDVFGGSVTFVVMPDGRIVDTVLSTIVGDTAKTPKLPESGGDVDVDTSDVPKAFLRFALAFTVSVRLPIVGLPPVESVIVISNVDDVDHLPV